MVDKINNTVKKTFKTLRSLVLLTLAFLAVFCVIQLIHLRSQSELLAASVAKMLELEVTNLEEFLKKTASDFDAEKARFKRNVPPEASLVSLRELISRLVSLEEVLWVGGDGKSIYGYSRSKQHVHPSLSDGSFKDSALFQTHQKGVVVVTPIGYTEKQVPFFHISYPLDGNEGGFLVSRVAMLEFLKTPMALAKELLGPGFDLSLLDNEGKILAFKNSQNSLSKFIMGIFRNSKAVRHLSCQVEVVPNKTGVMESLNPKKFFWISLAVAVFLTLLF